MRMLKNNILIRPIYESQAIKIASQKEMVDDFMRGTVVVVGNHVSEDVKVDDVILFLPLSEGHFPTTIVDNEELSIVPEHLIWAIE